MFTSDNMEKNRLLRSISPTATLRAMKGGSTLCVPEKATSLAALLMAKSRLNRMSGWAEWHVRVTNNAVRGKCYMVERRAAGSGDAGVAKEGGVEA